MGGQPAALRGQASQGTAPRQALQVHFAGNIGYFQQENSLSKGMGSSGMLGARYTNLARVKKGAGAGRGPLQGVRTVTSAERHGCVSGTVPARVSL